MADGGHGRPVPRALEALERLAGRDVVVIGSTARWLTGDDVDPGDLDVVVPADPDVRRAIVTALAGIGARIGAGRRSRPLTHTSRVAWDWQWRAETPWGPVDVITRLPDGTDHSALLRQAVGVALPSGRGVACVPTTA